MVKKKEKRGRKALLPAQKKPPQPTIKINEALFPFVKLLKAEYKAKRVDVVKMNALTQLLLGGLPVNTQVDCKPEQTQEED
jgi:hypothetical protein